MQTQETKRQHAHDFDFWPGRWRGANRKLLKLFVGCDEWERFDATIEVAAFPGGIGNYDVFLAEQWRPGFVGLSFRVYDPVADRWSIYWLENRSGGVDHETGSLLPPVVGRFVDGVGVFEGREIYEGRPIVVRYRWSNITPATARWEQSFSTDEGRTWEINWVSDMTRLAD
ncbi:MAG: hypothetical protein HOP12_10020 [Candidatus Eisenbacteria bacterium]|uniref:DUF1579 domain-containing protein n=1 Tax=Eiseniibacteriota bacterium TaxID=2212470 RepID=A0A849SL78_UNCEI|nr:hypothetical protein [Candidatus Eisenbacteria bacterium]